MVTGNKTLIFLLLACTFVPFGSTSLGQVQFNRDIRPILSEHCYHCHGPDETDRAAGLRLDKPAGIQHAFGEVDLDFNEAWQRLSSDDPDYQMPPPGASTEPTPEQISLLKKWVAQGAHYQDHWSLIPPAQREIPSVKNKRWVRNPIDAFVLSRLESEKLNPSGPATPEQLIRRVTIDLTGLPPTIKEIDDFVNDNNPTAYERVVDRLLNSPHYGERIALPWLDAARYADTNGFSIDDHRDMWLWREWVIDAFNNNLPYDQFVIQQLAGDLIPGASDEH